MCYLSIRAEGCRYLVLSSQSVNGGLAARVDHPFPVISVRFALICFDSIYPIQFDLFRCDFFQFSSAQFGPALVGFILSVAFHLLD